MQHIYKTGFKKKLKKKEQKNATINGNGTCIGVFVKWARTNGI